VAAKKTTTVELEFDQVQVDEVQVALLGRSPIILNRLAEKARQQLLMPAPRKNSAARQASLKHDPHGEFRSSPYTLADPDAATLLAIPSTALKGAMMSAALDLPGASKAQIGRLLYVEGEFLPLYGTPKMLMSIVRSADINRTPDVRTRAVVPEWLTIATIRFVVPLMRQASVANLLLAAGVTCGVGDWRPERGKGSFGQFEVCNLDDPRVQRILEQGRTIQQRAMAEPVPYNAETAELLEWFEGEYLRRTGGAVEHANGALLDGADELDEAEVIA
jgi:hypothetical protein